MSRHKVAPPGPAVEIQSALILQADSWLVAAGKCMDYEEWADARLCIRMARRSMDEAVERAKLLKVNPHKG